MESEDKDIEYEEYYEEYEEYDEEELEKRRLEKRRRLKERRKRELLRKKKQRFLVVNMVITFIILLVVGVLVLNIHSDKKELRTEGIKYLNEGKYGKAEKAFTEALEEKQWFSTKIDNDIKMYLAECYMYRAEFTEANMIYIELQAKNTGDIDNNYLLKLIELSGALMKMQNKYYKEAYPVLKENVEAGNKSINMYLATCYYNLEMYDEMVLAYKEYIADYGVNTYVAYQLATYYLSVDNYTDAEAIINSGLSANDDDYLTQVKFLEIVYLEKTNQYEQAWIKVNEYLKANPDSEAAKKERDFLDSRVNIDPTPVNGGSQAE